MNYKEIIKDFIFIVRWSGEDKAYIARTKEWDAVAAHGDTPDEALKELLVAINGFLEWQNEIEGGK